MLKFFNGIKKDKSKICLPKHKLSNKIMSRYYCIASNRKKTVIFLSLQFQKPLTRMSASIYDVSITTAHL